MLLKEFTYFDKTNQDLADDNRYLSQHDTSILTKKDVRKTRLTLEMLNDLRKAGEARQKEMQEDLGLIRKMYATPPPEQAAPA